MAWRRWDDYLTDTAQSAADAITRTDNGDNQHTTEEHVWVNAQTIADPDRERT